MQKTKETRKCGGALCQNAPRSTSIGGQSKSVTKPIESSETKRDDYHNALVLAAVGGKDVFESIKASEIPLEVPRRVLDTLPEYFQAKAHELEEKGLVRITGEA
jgi:hypothetical protein